MPGPGQVGRGWDLDRIIKNYEQRINTLEKLARGAGTSMFLIDTPRWRSRQAANATLANNTNTNLIYSTVGSAPDHDLGTGTAFAAYQLVAGEPRIVFATPGLYLVKASLQWNGAAGGTRKLHLHRNAVTTPAFSTEVANAGAGAGVHQDTMGVMGFAANDYLRIVGWQNSGGNLATVAVGVADQFADSAVVIVPLGAYDVA